MPIYEIDPQTTVEWNSYPVRIVGPDSECCGEPTFLVGSPGGWVKALCTACEKKNEKFSVEEFFDLGLWVACPSCAKRMSATKFDENNTYGYRCDNCETNETKLWLSVLLHDQDVLWPSQDAEV